MTGFTFDLWHNPATAARALILGHVPAPGGAPPTLDEESFARWRDYCEGNRERFPPGMTSESGAVFRLLDDIAQFGHAQLIITQGNVWKAQLLPRAFPEPKTCPRCLGSGREDPLCFHSFKRDGCGYVGTAQHCDKTLEGCKAHEFFEDHPWIPGSPVRRCAKCRGTGKVVVEELAAERPKPGDVFRDLAPDEHEDGLGP